MSRNERKDQSRKATQRRKRPNGATATTKPAKVWPENLIGAKNVRLLENQLRNMQEEDAHGNRGLFLDDVFVVNLLAFFNPTIGSLRTTEDLSHTQQAQKHLSVDKICKSTPSDFNQFVDPQRLVPIVQALRGNLSGKQAGPSRV